MNTPSTTGGNNWRWRMQSEALDCGLAQKIARLTKIYGR
jgi:4-alpha-glucanotransferase